MKKKPENSKIQLTSGLIRDIIESRVIYYITVTWHTFTPADEAVQERRCHSSRNLPSPLGLESSAAKSLMNFPLFKGKTAVFPVERSIR